MAQERALLAAIGWFLAVAFAPPCDARVVRFVVEQTRSFAGGMSFGDVGPYQRLDGTAYIPATGTFSLPLEGSPSFNSYPTSDTNTAHSTLTVRDQVSDQGQMTPIAADQWGFGTCPSGKDSLVADPTQICLFSRFQADKLYTLIYPAKNPIVMGLGYAVTRDIGSFLRYETQDDVGNSNPLAASPAQVGISRNYSFGSSSTGMYQREFLYLGFNEDESHRPVFDARWIHKSGTHRLFANVEFADPNTYSRQDDRQDFLSSTYPPTTFAVTTDPLSGIRDGLVKRPDTSAGFRMKKGAVNSTNPPALRGAFGAPVASRHSTTGSTAPASMPPPPKPPETQTGPLS